MFIFISGTKVKRQVITEYQDYCPVHRGLHTFELQQIRTKTHLYFVSLGKSKNEGFVGVGKDICRFARHVDPSQIQSIPAEERWAQRLEVERMIKTNPTSLPVETRVALFHESVSALELARQDFPDAEGNRAVRQVLLPSAGVFALTILMAVVGIPGYGWPMSFSILAMLLGSLVARAVAEFRYKRNVLATLAPLAIQPLALDPVTIKAELKVAKKAGSEITRRLRKLDLSTGINSSVEPAPTLIS